MLTAWKLRKKIRSESRKSRALQQDVCAYMNAEPTQFGELRQYKNSDVIFILGSGSSVNSLGSEQWDIIKKHDSLGINHWILHRHVPTFYTFEIPRLIPVREILLKNLHTRADDYRNTAVLMKAESGCGRGDLDFIAQLVSNGLKISVPAYYTVGDESQLICLLKQYEKIRPLFRGHGCDLFFRKRASIVFSAMLAYELGFSDIVFCGVDGYVGSRYFYEDSRSGHLAGDVVCPATSGQQVNRVHKTMDQSVDRLTADVCLRLMDQYLFQRNGVRMWVGTPNSMLSEWLPAWNWDI